MILSTDSLLHLKTNVLTEVAWEGWSKMSAEQCVETTKDAKTYLVEWHKAKSAAVHNVLLAAFHNVHVMLNAIRGMVICWCCSSHPALTFESDGRTACAHRWGEGACLDTIKVQQLVLFQHHLHQHCARVIQLLQVQEGYH